MHRGLHIFDIVIDLRDKVLSDQAIEQFYITAGIAL